ncbi:lysophospholipid acyltransferase family protein [Rhodopila sp.]|jgi:1-acyl-sn-glycerol-3-phosphate acyltransferase|uniref:lysophospholipid acyltransferase family protein n=1 Tax=Rhodopila sp. TaxID=2480087 RepID=UPI002D131626|nr:lysophospholipid acyltransferase family protein [Rhodopila sp.]HVZ09852.1 lysophospholipid acyltransferase family protein [Rhodopila sp.]
MVLLRSILFNIVFFTITFLLTFVAEAMRLRGPAHGLVVPMFWARLNLRLLRWICGIRVEVTGLENVPPGAALIASRHQSAFDIFVWLTLVPKCCYVLKRELLRIPLFGPLMLHAGMIAVDREAGGAALRSLLREGERAVREQRQIVIFPEGTRAPPGRIGSLQPGIAALAARLGQPVIPVSTNSGLFWGRRAFRKRPGVIRIVIGEPIPASTPRAALMRSLAQGMSVLDAPSKSAV